MHKLLLKFKKKSTSEKVTYIFYFVFFVLMAIIYLMPILITFFNSFRTLADYTSETRKWYELPAPFQFDSWANIFVDFKYKTYTFWDMLFNSVWYLALKVTVNVLSSTLLAYAIARFRFPGKNFLYGLAIFSQTVPIIGSGAAGYRLFVTLGLVDNPALIWIAWAVGFDYAFIILYGTFKGISMTYSEAAKIDGANNFVVLFKIILPQAFPAMVALAVTQAIGVWNDYSTPMIYLRKFPTLAYGLYLFSAESQNLPNANATYCAGVILSMIPVIILYASMQKLILTNLTTGGLKG